ncbi:FKBP12-interacting protein of 37 kDa, partial [Sesbania bispinosa]
VIMLQDKLEEKDLVIQRLKDELQQKSSMENGRTDAASNRKDIDEMIPTEDVN